MNSQRRQRIDNIKQLSQYLRRLLRFAESLLLLAWPFVLTLPFLVNDWTIASAGSVALPLGELTLPQRAAFALGLGVFLLLTQGVVRHTRSLMEHFSQGHIFEAAPIRSARKAIQFGMALLALRVLTEISLAMYLASFGKVNLPGVLSTLFYGFIVFGFLLLVQWAMEIGRDLHEESELTI